MDNVSYQIHQYRYYDNIVGFCCSDRIFTLIHEMVHDIRGNEQSVEYCLLCSKKQLTAEDIFTYVALTKMCPYCNLDIMLVHIASLIQFQFVVQI